MPKKGNLTPQDLLYVDCYIKNDFNQAKTFRELGYTKKTADEAYRYFRKPEVEKLIYMRANQMAEALGMSKEWHLAKLKTIVERFIPENPELIESVPLKEMIKVVSALSEIAKITGIYAPTKTETKHDVADELKDILTINKELSEKYKREY